MVLAAGLGKRMRPITDTLPKPLVKVAGKTLLDWGLDSLAEAGVEKAVVNVHYLPDQIVAHVAAREAPKSSFPTSATNCSIRRAASSRRCRNLERSRSSSSTPIHSGSTADAPNLRRLALEWDAARMDILLMLCRSRRSDRPQRRHGFSARRGRPAAARQGDPAGLIYAGAAIVHPRIFAGRAARPHSLNRYFDAAIAEGRLSACRCAGSWITVGTPDAIAPAEAAVARALGKGHEQPRRAARLLHSARRALPAGACRGAGRRTARTRFPCRQRSAGAGRRHHLCADPSRRARTAHRSSSSAPAGARQSCR